MLSRWGRSLLVGCGACLFLLATTASATVSPKSPARPDIRHDVHLSFDAPALPAGGYHHAVMALEPYRHYTESHQPPCSVSSDMQSTAYGYPQDGKVSLSLTPAKSHTGHWCSGGSYEGATYAVSPPRSCESTYSCEGERCASSPCRPLLGVVARPIPWAYPQPPPRPSSGNVQIVGWFVVRFHSHWF